MKWWNLKWKYILAHVYSRGISGVILDSLTRDSAMRKILAYAEWNKFLTNELGRYVMDGLVDKYYSQHREKP